MGSKSNYQPMLVWDQSLTTPTYLHLRMCGQSLFVGRTCHFIMQQQEPPVNIHAGIFSSFRYFVACSVFLVATVGSLRYFGAGQV